MLINNMQIVKHDTFLDVTFNNKIHMIDFLEIPRNVYSSNYLFELEEKYYNYNGYNMIMEVTKKIYYSMIKDYFNELEEKEASHYNQSQIYANCN